MQPLHTAKKFDLERIIAGPPDWNGVAVVGKPDNGIQSDVMTGQDCSDLIHRCHCHPPAQGLRRNDP